jgi:hypothetical protein
MAEEELRVASEKAEVEQRNAANLARQNEYLQEQAEIDRKVAAAAEDRERMRQAAAERDALESESFIEGLQDAYDKATKNASELFQIKLDTLSLDEEQTAEAWRLYEATEAVTQQREMQQKAVEAAQAALAGNVESIGTAIGGVRVSGMTSNSIERMMPTQEAIKSYSAQIARNTERLAAAGAP